MELRFGDPANGSDDVLGVVRAFSLAPSGWLLEAVLVEPEHRVGLGKWISIVDCDAASTDGELTVNLDGSQFEQLPAGESTQIVEGVRTSTYRVSSRPWLRLKAKEVAPAGRVVLNVCSPVRRDGAEIGHVSGLVADDGGRVRSVLMVKKKLIGTTEEELAVSGLTLADWGVEAG